MMYVLAISAEVSQSLVRLKDFSNRQLSHINISSPIHLLHQQLCGRPLSTSHERRGSSVVCSIFHILFPVAVRPLYRCVPSSAYANFRVFEYRFNRPRKKSGQFRCCPYTNAFRAGLKQITPTSLHLPDASSNPSTRLCCGPQLTRCT